MRRTITALLGGTALALAGLTTTIPASASASHPAAASIIPRYNPGDGFNIIVRLSTNGSSLVAQGVGNQMQILTSGPTSWNSTASGTGYKVMNNNGYCWTQDGANADLQNCVQGANSQRWIFSGTAGNTSIQNVGSGNFLGTFSPNGPRPVYVENHQSGFYSGWVKGN